MDSEVAAAVRRLIDKDQITLLDFMDLIDARRLTICIANQLGPEKPGKPSHRYGRRKLHNKEFQRS